MLSFLSRLLHKLSSQGQPKVIRRQPCYVRPRLEALEDRLLLDAYGFQDQNGNPNAGSYTAVPLWFDFTTNRIADRLPGSGDTADIPTGAVCTLNSTTQQTVAGMTVVGTFNLASKLNVTTLNPSGTFNIGASGELDDVGSADFTGGGTISGQVDAGGSGVTFDPYSFMTLATGAKLTGLGVYNINGAVTCSAALSQNSPIFLNNDSHNTFGSLTGTGSLSLGGVFDWNGGSLGLAGGVTLQPNSGFKMQGSDTKFLTAGTITSLAQHADLGGTGFFVIDNGATFDNEAGQTGVSLPLIMDGSAMGTGEFINNANGIMLFQANASMPTVITANFTNTGTLKVATASALIVGPSMGATYNLDGTLQLDGDLTLEGAVSSPTGVVEDSGGGSLIIGAGINAGSLTLASGYDAVLFGKVEVTGSGTLTGGGQVANNGTLKVDIGGMTSIGSYQETSTGTLELQAIAGPPPTSSALTVSGLAQLSGTLKLDFLDGYNPTSGTAFTVLTMGSIGGHFDTTPDNMTPTYGPTSVTLTQN